MGSLGVENSFSAPPEIHEFHGLLFDFDGTIIDSTDAIVKHWHRLGKEMGVDPNVILATSHGRRSIDVLKLYDPSKANNEFISEMEGRIPIDFGRDAVEIPGARKLLNSLEEQKARWAVVTSGTQALVDGWLNVMKLAHPKFLITAEAVANGKPDPECYRLGQSRLGLSNASNILVFEDAPSGVRAGKAAGFKVLGLATTHTVEQVRAAGADWIVQDLRSVQVLKQSDGISQVQISNALVES